MSNSICGVVVTNFNDTVLVSTLLQGGYEKLLEDCATLEVEAAKLHGRELSRQSLANRYGVSFSIVPDMRKLVVNVMLAGHTHILFVSLDREAPPREEEEHPWQGPQREIHIQVGDFRAGPMLLDLALSVLSTIGLAYRLDYGTAENTAAQAIRHPYPLRIHDMLGNQLLQPYVFEALADEKLLSRGPLKDAGLFEDLFDMSKLEYSGYRAHAHYGTRWASLHKKVKASGTFMKLLPYWPTSLEDLKAD